jgi:hypothetical protein
MFGLMRVKKCGMSDAEKHFRRLHYCGTCKTIGSLYGQKSRLLLNHDTVFLAEILTSLSDENPKNWQRAYQSYNCLSLPEKRLPLPLEFAATTNLILAEFKLADKITDENSRAGKIARKAFSSNFQKARRKLENWRFPLEKVQEILSSQETIEADSSRADKSADEILDALSRPTAETTAIFFGAGARLIGKNEPENPASELGFNFGKLIYLLDAFEDYEKDFAKKQFNAIRAAFRLDEEKIPLEIKRKIVALLQESERAVAARISELPIAENQKTLFIARLRSNLQRKFKTSLPVLKTTKICSPPRQTLSERWRSARQTAGNLAREFSWQMPLVFLFVFAFALVAPAQTKEAKSARECFDLGFNLMFLGAVFGSVFVSAKTILMENPEELLTKQGRRKKLRKAASESGGGEGWCDSCECCCCDGGCCDGCDCCSGCCDNCDCGGCCDCSCD